MLTFRFRLVEVKSHFDKLLAAPLHVIMSNSIHELYTNNSVKVSNCKPKKKTVVKSNTAPRIIPTRTTRSTRSIETSQTLIPNDNSMPSFTLENDTMIVIDPFVEPIIGDEPILATFEPILEPFEPNGEVVYQRPSQIAAETYNEK